MTLTRWSMCPRSRRGRAAGLDETATPRHRDSVDRVAVVLPPRPRAIYLGGPDLEYTEREPGRDLAPWVQSFWRLRCIRATSLRVLPDGCMDIINGDVVGSLSEPLVADMQPGEEAVGVRLRPGAFTALYGVPADELTDRRVPLADLVRPRGLLEAVRDAGRPD